jgi:hypothetical protein
MTPRHPCQECRTAERELGRVVCRLCLDVVLARVTYTKRGVDQRAQAPEEGEEIQLTVCQWTRLVDHRRNRGQ